MVRSRSNPVTSFVSGIFGKPFTEAVAALAKRVGNLVGTAKWDDLQKAQHEKKERKAR